MMVASEKFRQEGFDVTTVHPKLVELQPWFPGHRLEKEVVLTKTTSIIAENDNSAEIARLKKEYRDHLTIFYPTYREDKHGPLHSNDRVFDASKSMVDNIGIAAASLLHLSSPSKNNGLTPPSHLKHRLYPHRVAIHPTSSSPLKNWPLAKYKRVASYLKTLDFDPVFVPEFPTLSDLAAFIYESGFLIGNDSLLGHLASNLNIPTLMIADNKERMQLWRPGWLLGEVVTPPSWLPFNAITRHWQHFISPRRVLKTFQRMKKGR